MSATMPKTFITVELAGDNASSTVVTERVTIHDKVRAERSARAQRIDMERDQHRTALLLAFLVLTRTGHYDGDLESFTSRVVDVHAAVETDENDGEQEDGDGTPTEKAPGHVPL